MRTKNIRLAIFAAAALLLGACSDDDLKDESIFKADLEQVAQMSEFDQWLDKNYRETYNINFKYRYIDNESDRSYNVIPADYAKSKALAILVKHMWLDVYTELLDTVFLRTYAPRIIQLTGSFQYQANDSGESGGIVLGTAEGGIKVMLYGVNSLDPENIYVNTVDPYSPARFSTELLDLNHWFFHTMHHEFCHILTQKKEYSTDFRTISADSYYATDWINITDKKAAGDGFVTGYAGKEYNEDFAEIYSTYVTMSADAWAAIEKQAGEKGLPILRNKLKLLRDYFKNSWNLDIDKVREVVLRRSQEAQSLDLSILN